MKPDTAKTSTSATEWNAELYQSSHSYVWRYGHDLLQLLDPKPGERILDVGCGTGQLTAEVANAGADVLGTDASPEMIANARKNHPAVRFEVADARALPFHREFDAVLSNAALHWIRDQDTAIASIARALKGGGRFVFEMGGHGNLKNVLAAGYAALRSFDVPQPEARVPWIFPGIGEYAPLLERHGLQVRLAALFERPTELQGGVQGMANWIAMFGAFARAAVPGNEPELVRRWEDLAAPKLLRDGVWTADYMRLRMVAIKKS